MKGVLTTSHVAMVESVDHLPRRGPVVNALVLTLITFICCLGRQTSFQHLGKSSRQAKNKLNFSFSGHGLSHIQSSDQIFLTISARDTTRSQEHLQFGHTF